MRITSFFLAFLLVLGLQAQLAETPDTNATFEKGSADAVKSYDYFFQTTKTGIDTSLDDFTTFRPTEQESVPFGHLGPAGSAAFPLMYQPTFSTGAYLGFDQYNLYLKRPEELNFYNGRFPFTDLYYVQGLHGLQLFNAVFGMQLGDQVDVGFDYEIVSDNGFFNSQQHRLNLFDAHLRYQTKSGRNKTLVGYVLNDVKALQSGGLDTTANPPDTVFNLTRSPSDAFMKLDATTRYKENIFFLHHRYLFGNTKVIDTAGNKELQPNGHELFYDGRYQVKSYNYRDDNPGEGYSAILLSSDSTNDLTRANIWSQRAGWKFQAGSDSAINNWKLAAFASWDQWSIHQQGRRYNLTDVAVNGTADISLGKAFHLQANGKYHTGGYAFGDWQLNGALSLKPLKFLELKVNTDLRRSTPSFITQHYLSNHFYWDGEFEGSKQTYTALSPSVVIAPLNLELGIGWSITDNLVYFDETGLPQQHDPAFSVWQFKLFHHLEIGKLNLEIRLWFQLYPSDAPLNLPSFVSRHRLYLDTRLFEAKVPTHFGLEVYYHTPFVAPVFQQVAGQFGFVQGEKTWSYPVVEPYISMKVNTVRLFFKVTNADQFYPFTDSYQFVKDYPIFPTAFALGVSWRFFN